MATNTKSKSRRRGPSPEAEARREAVELAITAIDEDTPGWSEFAALWDDIYDPRFGNIHRIYVQRPTARPKLHRYETWVKMGRFRPRKGETAIWVKLPHTSHREDKITAENPTGETFTGSHWAPLFCLGQTVDIDDWDETVPDADPDEIARIRQLRAAAVALHPDVTGDTSQEGARSFSQAWDAYEAARARMTGATR